MEGMKLHATLGLVEFSTASPALNTIPLLQPQHDKPEAHDRQAREPRRNH